jgi:hypothetical protein
MLTASVIVVLALSPCIIVLALLVLATWRERVRDQVLARQATLTYAIHRELGGVASPIVTKGLAAPWRIRMAVPLGRPASVAAVLAIVNRELESSGVAQRERYQIVLTREPARARPRPSAAAGYAAAGRSVGSPDIAATAQFRALLEKD